MPNIRGLGRNFLLGSSRACLAVRSTFPELRIRKGTESGLVGRRVNTFCVLFAAMFPNFFLLEHIEFRVRLQTVDWSQGRWCAQACSRQGKPLRDDVMSKNISAQFYWWIRKYFLPSLHLSSDWAVYKEPCVELQPDAQWFINTHT